MIQLNNRIDCLLISFVLTFTLLYQEVAVGAGSDRIYPTKEVTIFNGDKIVGSHTREAPLPEGATISTSGRCAIKLGDLYLVAEDQSLFSVNSSIRQRNIFLKKGIIYIKTSIMAQPFNFITPAGQITVQRVRLDASFDDQSVISYLIVDKTKSELGVVQGGSLDILSENGLKAIKPGEKIILAQADMDIGAPESDKPVSEAPPGEEQAKKEPEGMSTVMKGTLIGGVAVLALGGLAAMGGGGGGGGGGPVSPSSP